MCSEDIVLTGSLGLWFFQVSFKWMLGGSLLYFEELVVTREGRWMLSNFSGLGAVPTRLLTFLYKNHCGDHE